MRTFQTIRSSVGTDHYDTYVDLSQEAFLHYLLTTCLRITLEAGDQIPEVEASELAELCVVVSDMKRESCQQHAEMFRKKPSWTLGSLQVGMHIAAIARRVADALATGRYPVQDDSSVTEMATELRRAAEILVDWFDSGEEERS